MGNAKAKGRKMGARLVCSKTRKGQSGWSIWAEEEGKV